MFSDLETYPSCLLNSLEVEKSDNFVISGSKIHEKVKFGFKPRHRNGLKNERAMAQMGVFPATQSYITSASTPKMRNKMVYKPTTYIEHKNVL